ncbi:MAG: transglycosylase SLT domain-containing protein [Edaphobacter sp.]|uniref:transglycosylase SLT domain-containing protein n=1 Tax=Edaphobacter sp. TaxID=1934404 RepID=UPI00239B0974|nr:transglycosylase SLT domain-containing protein [Edaphobacter sp.]MDE1178443.1 transglycosylase SLT domain-containing protein [Edaphobacter sp.]
MLTVRSKFLIFALPGCLLAGLVCPSAQGYQSSAKPKSQTKSSSSKKAPAKSSSKTSKSKAATGSKSKAGTHSSSKTSSRASSKKRRSKPTAQTIRLTTAFHASEQLRPMAQQLAAARSAAAYSGVESYAHGHPGEAAATAWLAIGHAYMLDRRYPEAMSAFRQASTSGKALDDYADYLGAQAALAANQGAAAYSLLDRFAERHPDSIFVATAPTLLANAYLQQNNPQKAIATLQPLAETAQGAHSDFRYALGRAYQLAGDVGHAAPMFRSVYVKYPLSGEAPQAKAQLDAMGVPLTAVERKIHADTLFNAKRYTDASQEYHDIARNDTSLSQSDKDSLAIYAAVCEMKLKRIGRRDVERLPQTADDTAAAKLYMLAEISRSEKKEEEHTEVLNTLIKQFPKSRWLEEALYSGGNMYLLKHDYQQAIYHYKMLVDLFPKSSYAPSAHWRVAWMNYRLRNYPEAARLMDEQIVRYGAGIEAPTALYWRGRIYEDEEHNSGQALNYYRSLSESYTNYYYAGLARKRIAMLASSAPAVPAAEALASVRPLIIPTLTGELPENEPHLIKARLLANAALNEYIGPEIQAGAGSEEWGVFAQADIYNSFGETTRALQSMKRSGISFFSLPVSKVPMAYWKILFPRPYWAELSANAQKNNLDPYLVASLIRQESEFNAGAVSHANAYGLMQLLPSVGKSLAKKQGLKGIGTTQLLNPSINLQLGTYNMRLVIDRYSGQLEYALASYNAGDVPVRQWMGSSDYKDIAEYVESIPYTETREYVQAILRNQQIYHEVYAGH